VADEPVKLTVAKPTAESLAALYRKLTGKEPDLAYIRQRLAEAEKTRTAADPKP
jgi:hypothetical protein